MKSSDSLKGLLPINVLQIGCGSFGVHLQKHLQKRVESLKVISGISAKLPDVEKFDFIFLATNDKSLKSLITDVLEQKPAASIIHFSGFHYFENALGLHPVASFNKESNYNLDEITFVADGPVDENLISLFPKRALIDPLKKQSYHNFLSVSANALQLLMNNIGSDFEEALDMSSELLKKIVIQSLNVEKEKGVASFSGPWIRGEKKLQDLSVDSIKSESLKNLNHLFKKEIKIFEKRSNEERHEHPRI